MDRSRQNEVLLRLEAWGAERSWVGPDPYEGLNSALGRIAPGIRGKQAVVQAYKRLPFSPPWPLRATPRPNSKALALALSGYATPRGAELPGAEWFLEELPRELERMALVSAGAKAWGYHFDAQTRHLFYGSETPNAVATCFVVEALLEAHSATGRAALAALALRARPYLLSLLRRDGPPGPFFAYVATGSELIHNANLLVGACLARLHELDPDGKTESAVRASVETTLRLQRDDGLWPYGERADLSWIDNFHTAYVLESLAHLERVLGIGAEELVAGLSAWRQRFFGPDGRAFFYPDREYPLEAHSYASAIDCLCAVSASQLGEDPQMLARRIADSAVRELWQEDEGRFAFKRTGRGLNRRPYMRWTNAPMFRALSRLAEPATRSSPALAAAARAGGA